VLGRETPLVKDCLGSLIKTVLNIWRERGGLVEKKKGSSPRLKEGESRLPAEHPSRTYLWGYSKIVALLPVWRGIKGVSNRRKSFII